MFKTKSIQRYRALFNGHRLDVLRSYDAEIGEVAPWFRVLRVAPGPGNHQWMYLTIRARELNMQEGAGVEFFIRSEVKNDELPNLLARLVCCSQVIRLGVGNSIPLPAGWQYGLRSDHLLLLPSDLPQLDTLAVRGSRSNRILRAVPATRDEVLAYHLRGQDQIEGAAEVPLLSPSAAI